MKLLVVAGPPSSGKTSVILQLIAALEAPRGTAGVVKFDCLTSFDHEQPGAIVRRNGQKLFLRQDVFRLLYTVGSLHLRCIGQVGRGTIGRGRAILAGAKAADEHKREHQRKYLFHKYVASSTYSRCVKAEAYAKGGNPVYKYFLKG